MKPSPFSDFFGVAASVRVETRVANIPFLLARRDGGAIKTAMGILRDVFGDPRVCGGGADFFLMRWAP